MIPSFRALVWSGAMALVSVPVLPQWEYAWAFQSDLASVENCAQQCQFTPNGSIVLTGSNAGTVTLGNVYWYPQSMSSEAGYVALLDPLGDVQWAHFFGEKLGFPYPPFNYPNSLEMDAGGNIFIGGSFGDSLYWENTLLLTDTANDPGDLFDAMYLVKLDTAGDILWSTTMSVGGGRFGDLTVNADGDLLVVGWSVLGQDTLGHLLKFNGIDGSVIFHHVSTSGVVLENIGIDDTGNIFVQGVSGGSFTLGGGPTCPFNNVLGPSF
ncbi:MAG: hypothetical protein IPK99_09080 [Flavobacteriales bacterium]|nr:hypothetical protein [Flavobacteriales bacterium]